MRGEGEAGRAGGRVQAVTHGRDGVKPGDADVVKGGLEGEKGGILSVTARKRLDRARAGLGRRHTRPR